MTTKGQKSKAIEELVSRDLETPLAEENHVEHLDETKTSPRKNFVAVAISLTYNKQFLAVKTQSVERWAWNLKIVG